MSSETQEVVRICEQLPQPQRARVAEYARSLLAAADSGGKGPPQHPGTSATRMEALNAAQASLALTPDGVRQWVGAAAAERKAWGRGG